MMCVPSEHRPPSPLQSLSCEPQLSEQVYICSQADEREGEKEGGEGRREEGRERKEGERKECSGGREGPKGKREQL